MELKKGFLSQLKQGMQVELEHRDVTKGDPVMTARIALGHLAERKDYYTKLKKAGLNPEPWVRDYWDTHLENNKLRMHAKTDAGAHLAWMIEAGGDVLRETGKTPKDRSYIKEKTNRIRRELNSRDWRDPLHPDEEEYLAGIKHKLTGLQPAGLEMQANVGLIKAIADRDPTRVAQWLNRVESIHFKYNPIKHRNPTKGNFAWVLLGLGIIAVLAIPMFRNAEGSLTLIEYLRRGR